MTRREELATAVLATLNNITFYLEVAEPLDHLDGTLEQLCRGNRGLIYTIVILSKARSLSVLSAQLYCFFTTFIFVMLIRVSSLFSCSKICIVKI